MEELEVLLWLCYRGTAAAAIVYAKTASEALTVMGWEKKDDARAVPAMTAPLQDLQRAATLLQSEVHLHQLQQISMMEEAQRQAVAQAGDALVRGGRRIIRPH